MASSKIVVFKRLYVATHQLFDTFDARLDQGISDVQSLDLAIQQVDTLINMLPLKFPALALEYPHTPVLHINYQDAEDEPEETSTVDDGHIEYETPENTHTLFEDTVLTVLENWKFLLWNHMVARTKDFTVQRKYLPLMLAQAHACMLRFVGKDRWKEWEKDMFVLYTNQIAWFAYVDEQEADTLEAALRILEEGDRIADWNRHAYIKDTKVRMLIRLGRLADAYSIVQEVLTRYPDFEDFADLKADAHYIAWQEQKMQGEKE
jgi:hypothetical protein